MARSTYIYAAMHRAQPMPVATFTVKHEMRRWLSTLTPASAAGLRLFRMDDGPGGVIAEMNIVDILGPPITL